MMTTVCLPTPCRPSLPPSDVRSMQTDLGALFRALGLHRLCFYKAMRPEVFLWHQQQKNLFTQHGASHICGVSSSAECLAHERHAEDSWPGMRSTKTPTWYYSFPPSKCRIFALLPCAAGCLGKSLWESPTHIQSTEILHVTVSRQASFAFSRYSPTQLAVLESHCRRVQPTLRARQILLWSADPSQASVAFSRYSLMQLAVLESHCRGTQPTLKARKILPWSAESIGSRETVIAYSRHSVLELVGPESDAGRSQATFRACRSVRIHLRPAASIFLVLFADRFPVDVVPLQIL